MRSASSRAQVRGACVRAHLLAQMEAARAGQRRAGHAAVRPRAFRRRLRRPAQSRQRASDLIVYVLGEAGRHARAPSGTNRSLLVTVEIGSGGGCRTRLSSGGGRGGRRPVAPGRSVVYLALIFE